MNTFTLTQDQFAELQATLDEVKKSISWIETLLICATLEEIEPEKPEVELKICTA